MMGEEEILEAKKKEQAKTSHGSQIFYGSARYWSRNGVPG